MLHLHLCRVAKALHKNPISSQGFSSTLSRPKPFAVWPTAYCDILPCNIRRLWRHIKQISHCGHNDFQKTEFQGLSRPCQQIQKLSRPNFVFKKFPGLEKEKTQELSRTCGHPVCGIRFFDIELKLNDIN